MNQYGPPPTSAGSVMVNPTHSMAPVTSNGPPNHRLPGTGGINQHTSAGQSMDNHRTSYPPRHQRGSQQNISKYRTAVSSNTGNGHHHQAPPPNQYSRPPPPLAGVQKILPPSESRTSNVSLVADVSVSAKQKSSELKEKTPMCLVNELARFNKVFFYPLNVLMNCINIMYNFMKVENNFLCFNSIVFVSKCQ